MWYTSSATLFASELADVAPADVVAVATGDTDTPSEESVVWAAEALPLESSEPREERCAGGGYRGGTFTISMKLSGTSTGSSRCLANGGSNTATAVAACGTCCCCCCCWLTS